MSNTHLTNMKKFTATASIAGQVVSSFSYETVNDPDKACERFLQWFLYRRSEWFDLTPEDIEPIKESRRPVEIPKHSDAEMVFEADIKGQTLTIAFFPIKFII